MEDAGALIFETLKQELLDLTIKPGEEIVESDVCRRFSVTRPPVRTALRRLSDMALVDIKPYYGTHATLLSIDKIYQVIHMRTVLETVVIQDYIDSRPDAYQIEELEHNIRLQQILLDQAAKDGKEIDHKKFYELDSQLHGTWFQNSHCAEIWNIIESQKTEYTRFRMLDLVVTMKYEDLVADHLKILEAIKSSNKEAVKKIIGRHIYSGVERMGDRVFTDYAQFIVQPKDMEYWKNYMKEAFTD